MRNFRGFGCRAAVAGIAFGALVGVTSLAHAAIVANTGLIDPSQAEVVGCNANQAQECTTTSGTSGGTLPLSGAFTHEVVFSTDQNWSLLALTSLLDSSDFDISSVELFNSTGSTTVGDDAAGTLVAGQNLLVFNTGEGEAYQITLGNLAAGTYFVRIVGSVLDSTASYSQQLSVSPVPLPAPLLLLGAALAALIGFSRIRRNRAAGATA